jgi:hypothetical protein
MCRTTEIILKLRESKSSTYCHDNQYQALGSAGREYSPNTVALQNCNAGTPGIRILMWPLYNDVADKSTKEAAQDQGSTAAAVVEVLGEPLLGFD